ncbi:MAG TPA: hypothetical protein VFB06_06165 [Streptosporangiaceae bacterium]|nr:hypothetical protein [Streptosporangiaceae bacterium]
MAATSASSSADASSAGSGSGPLASLSAQQIASKATADFKAASSVHAVGTISGEKIDLTIAHGKCAGTIGTSAGPLKLIQIGHVLWISAGGSSQYLKTSAGNSQYEGMVGFCTLAAIAQDFSVAGAALVKGPVTEIAGQQAITLTLQGATDKSYVSDTGTPEYLRTDQSGVDLDFSRYNARVSITAPPASDVIGG